MDQLPVDALLPQLRQTLASSSIAVLQAAPGAGKTTRVPLALLDCDWLAGKKIIMLEPRRLAARAAARYMARVVNDRLGGLVGYRVRLDTKVTSATRVEVVTEGVLGRMLQDDPALEDVGLVIFDEFHERNLQADLALALCLDSQDALREDLRILVMSATLAAAAVAKVLGDCPVLTSAGRSFPVDVRYHSLRAVYHRQKQAFCSEVARFIEQVLQTERGSMLVFLPGIGEIRRVFAALQVLSLPPDIQLAPLYGQLDARAQDAAIAPSPQGQRKVVLATAVAETSLTIEGIRIVVDAGLMRYACFDPNTGLDRLLTQPVSRAAAEQRSGRAGRLEAGVCYRLWSEHRHLVPQNTAEILQADLAALKLELAQWGVRDVGQLTWIDPPPDAHLAQAHDLLLRLQAIDEQGAISAHGRSLVRLGSHPRLAHMMVLGKKLGYARLACELAVLLSERDPLSVEDSDIQLRIEWLRGKEGASAGSQKLRRQLQATVDQWLRQLHAGAAPGNADDLSLCGVLLAFAYPDRIARRRSGQSNRFLLANGRGARFIREEPLAAEELIVAAHLDGEQEARIFLAASLTRDQLQRYLETLIEERVMVAWHVAGQCVQAVVQDRVGALVLAERQLEKPDPQVVETAMLEGIRNAGLSCLPWDRGSRQLQARVNLMHSLNEDEWPDLNDDELFAGIDDWLRPYLPGVTRLAQLKQLDLNAMLRARLSWDQQRQLDELVPEHLVVPSGSRVRLDYGGPVPVLAVRLQELFGLEETPRIAAGRVTVLLHLLSPAHRPLQVTQDLAGFWAGSYHQVKKDMKGRYPRHYWPDDPVRAQATARAKPRK